MQLIENITSATLFDSIEEVKLRISHLSHPPIEIIEMSEDEFNNVDGKLQIDYYFIPSPFGDTLVATTAKGICYMAFTDDREKSIAHLYDYFPKATFQSKASAPQQDLNFIFTPDHKILNSIKLHVKGTEFQVKVWHALLQIPLGRLTTYGNIADEIQQVNASRAVGTAIGSNPVAYLIPCHRVVQSTGKFGNYMWGPERKSNIIHWEKNQAGTF